MLYSVWTFVNPLQSIHVCVAKLCFFMNCCCWWSFIQWHHQLVNDYLSFRMTNICLNRSVLWLFLDNPCIDSSKFNMCTKRSPVWLVSISWKTLIVCFTESYAMQCPINNIHLLHIKFKRPTREKVARISWSKE